MRRRNLPEVRHCAGGELMPEIAELAYEKFCVLKGYGKHVRFSWLPPEEQDIWREVAREVMKKGWTEAARTS